MPRSVKPTNALCAMLEVEPGPSIHLMRTGQYFPEVWSFIQGDYHMKSWKKLGLNEEELAIVISALRPDQIQEHVNRAEGMDFFGRLRECEHVENDRLFRWDIKYVMAFVKMLEVEQGLGSPEALWRIWLERNREAMQSNLAERDRHGNVTSASLTMSDYRVSLKEAQEIVMEGAEYRCKRNYAAFVRELYVLACLAAGNEDFPGMRVFWHPLWDMACKCDAVVVPEKSARMGVVGLAVYLKSSRSNRNASLKADSMPYAYVNAMHHILSLAIPIERGAYQTGKVILPREHQLNLLRMALNGERTAMHQLGGAYYSENANLMEKTSV